MENREKLEKGLEIIYDDGEVVVMLTPTFPQLKQMIYELLKEKEALSIREIQNLLPVPVSDGRIKSVLEELIKDGLVYRDVYIRKYVLIT